jgi:hypothetical protein
MPTMQEVEMKDDPVEDAAHPTGTHEAPGAAETPGTDTGSGEEGIIDGKNPTQRKIDAEKERSDEGSEKPVTP